MSYKLKGVLFDHKKFAETNFNFEVEEGKMVNIVTSSKDTHKQIKHILRGKYNILQGQYKIDGYDKVDAKWTGRHIMDIEYSNFFYNFISPRFVMFFSLLFNRQFLSEARTKYIDSKYNYLSFTTSNNNKTDLEMRNAVELLLEKFISSTTEVEEHWLKEFSDQITTFNNKKIDEEFKGYEDHIVILIKDYFLLREKLSNHHFLETFLQSLWDKVYSFLDLRSSCYCEFEAKASKNKEHKKIVKQLRFKQHEYVVRKELKKIDVQVLLLKSKTFSRKRTIKSLEQQIKRELKKSTAFKESNKTWNDLFNFKQLSSDQRDDFRQKQEKMFFKGLSDEATIIRGKVVEIIHSLHKKLLSNATEQGNFNDFKVIKKELKLKISSIPEQAVSWTNNWLKKIGIDMDLSNKKHKFSKMNIINLKLLQAIFLSRKNVIFDNVLSRLSRGEVIELKNTLEHLIDLEPNMSFIFIEKSKNNILDTKEDYYLYQDRTFEKHNFVNDLKFNHEEFSADLFYRHNRVFFKTDGKHFNVEGKKWDLNTTKPSGQLILNPFKITNSKKLSEKTDAELIVKIKKSSIFKDPNLQCGVAKNGSRFYFYKTEPIENGVTTIYIPNNSVITEL